MLSASKMISRCFLSGQRRLLSSIVVPGTSRPKIVSPRTDVSTDKALFYFIRDKIKTSGPITVHEYMQLAAGSGAGYYANQSRTGDEKEPGIFGAKGDFITSPEVSQVFGELIGVWVFNELGNAGHRGNWQLVELGPGTGRLMSDILRVLERFRESNLTVHLVEISDHLIDEQERRLCGSVTKNVDNKSYVRKSRSNYGVTIYWHRDVADVPEEFTVFVANEFLDALPIHQFTKPEDASGWHEVYVTLDDKAEGDKLCFMRSKGENLHTKGLIPESIRTDPNRKFWEVSPGAATCVTQVTERIVETGGFALFIDYGHNGDRSDFSLRSYHRHDQVHPLDAPGRDDITADVDFGYLSSLIAPRALVYGPSEQRHFLTQLGVLPRVEFLMKQCATKEDRQSLFNAYRMLMGSTDDGGMGERFKAFSIFPKTLEGIMKKRGGWPDGFRPPNVRLVRQAVNKEGEQKAEEE